MNVHYQGRCHCGAISFSFDSPAIERGIRCNCSICIRKGTSMSAFTLAPAELQIVDRDNSLNSYRFGSEVATHYFCRHCGIYTFHETLRKPGHFRVNLGCIEGINALELPADIFDGASI